MKQRLLSILVCPEHKTPLSLVDDVCDEHGEILSGKLCCDHHGSEHHYPIRDAVPRFTPSDHYSSSFGLQWNKYDKTQLDSHSGLSITRDRYNWVCRWQEKLTTGWGIEAGCGAGRFSEILADEPIDWVCVDASSAVDANQRNNGHRYNIHVVQADLRHPPFLEQQFDRMICLGVLQHTPDPEHSFFSLLPLIKQQYGEFAFDIYSKTTGTWLWSKYWFRPITKRLPKPWLFRILEVTVPTLLLIHDLMRFIPYVGRYLAHRLVPVCNYKYSFPFNRQQNLEWALLDTFDMLAPEHDHPKSMDDLKGWLKRVPHDHQRLEYGPNGIIGQLRRVDG